MISVKFDSSKLIRDLDNIVQYSFGFIEGVQLGKKEMLKTLGASTIELIKNYIDSQARVDPQLLHHVYEWAQTGSPDARLYDISYTTSNIGLSFKSSFSQSKSIKEGSNVPFYDKATIMENGVPVTIKPKNRVLAFDVDEETIFTTNPVTVENPGGPDTKGAFEKVFDSFFTNYFTQSFLRISGVLDYLENPTAYKKNLPSGKKFGRSFGVSTGYRWIANVGVDL